MKIKSHKVKFRRVKSTINHPNEIVCTPPLSKYLCVKYKRSIPRKRKEDLKKNLEHFSERTTKTNIPIFEYDEDCLLKIESFNEISDVSSKVVDSVQSSLINQANCQNNVEVPLESENMNNLSEETKPVNWKLQKLEKDFLLKYLESTLQKYDKRTCKQTWIPSRNKNYSIKGFSNLQNKAYDVHLTGQGYISTLPKRKVNSSIQRTTFKNNSSQTENKDDMPMTYENYRRMIQSSYFIIDAVDLALKDKNLEPLLALDTKKMKKFHDTIFSLYGVLRDSGIYDEKNQSKKESLRKSGELNKKKIDSQLVVQSRDKVEEEKFNDEKKENETDKKQKKKIPEEETIVPSIIEIVTGLNANEKLEEIKNSSLRLSENYILNEGLSQPPLVDNIFDDFVIYKSRFEEEQTEQLRTKSIKNTDKDNTDERIDYDFKKENNEKKNFDEINTKNKIKNETAVRFDDDFKKENNENKNVDEIKIKNKTKVEIATMKKDVNTYLKDRDENLRQVSGNKNLLHSTLILISEALQRSCYTIPIEENTGSVLSDSLLIKTGMNVDENLLTDDFVKEILKEFNNVCKYFDLTNSNESFIYEILDNIKELTDETVTKVDRFVLNVVGDASILKEFFSFTQYLTKTFDPVLLGEYINNILEPSSKEEKSLLNNIDTENSSEDPVRDILTDYDLLSHTLAVIQIWSKRKRNVKEDGSGTSKSSSAISNDDSFTKTYNSEDAHADMKKVCIWINEISDDLLERNDIIDIYEELVRSRNVKGIDKLRKVLVDPNLLSKLAKNMSFSHEVLLRANEICKLGKEIVFEGNELNIPEGEGQSTLINHLLSDPALIRQFMSIVNYLNIENDEENVEDFSIRKDQELIKEYSKESKSIMLLKLYKLSNWLSLLDNHCIFSDVPQYNAMTEIVVSNILNVIKHVDLHPVIGKIFNDSKLLSEAIGSVRVYITSDAAKHGHHRIEKSSKHTTENVEICAKKAFTETRSLSELPERSKCKGKNHRYSDSEAENIDLGSDSNRESTSQNVTSLNNLLNQMEPNQEHQVERSSLMSENLQEIRMEIPNTSKDSLLYISTDIFGSDSNQKIINPDHKIVIKEEETRKILYRDEKVLSKGGSDKPTTFKTLPFVANTLKSIDEMDTNLGIMETENEEEIIDLDNKTDFNINVLTDDVIQSKSMDSNDEEKSNLEILPSKITSNTESPEAEKLSFNSQMNAMVLVLDDTLASIELKYQSIKDMEADIARSVVNTNYEKESGQVTTKIVFFESKETKSKLGCNSLMNIKYKESLMTNDEILNAEMDPTKFSQATSFDANISFENNENVLELQLASTSKDSEKVFVNEIEDAIASIERKSKEIKEKIEFTEINPQHNIDVEKEILRLSRHGSYEIHQSKMEHCEFQLFNNVEDPKSNYNIELDQLVSTPEKIMLPNVVEDQGSPVLIQVRSSDFNNPMINKKIIVLDDLEKESSINLKNQIYNLALKLDETIAAITLISHDLHQIGYSEPDKSPTNKELASINVKEKPGYNEEIQGKDSKKGTTSLEERTALNLNEIIVSDNISSKDNVDFKKKLSEVSDDICCETIVLSNIISEILLDIKEESVKISEENDKIENIKVDLSASFDEEKFCETIVLSDSKSENRTDIKEELTKFSGKKSCETIILSDIKSNNVMSIKEDISKLSEEICCETIVLSDIPLEKDIDLKKESLKMSEEKSCLTIELSNVKSENEKNVEDETSRLSELIHCIEFHLENDIDLKEESLKRSEEKSCVTIELSNIISENGKSAKDEISKLSEEICCETIVLSDIPLEKDIDLKEGSLEMSEGKSCVTIELSNVKSENGKSEKEEMSELSELLYCINIQLEKDIDFKEESLKLSEGKSCVTIVLSNVISENGKSLKEETSELSEGMCCETIILSKETSEKDIGLDDKRSELSGQKLSGKENVPYIKIDEVDFHIEEKNPNMSFNSQLNTLALKLEETMASIDIKYQEIKEFETEVPFLNEQAISNQIIIFDEVENEPKVSFKSQMTNLASRLDETVALVDEIHKEIKTKDNQCQMDPDEKESVEMMIEKEIFSKDLGLNLENSGTVPEDVKLEPIKLVNTEREKVREKEADIGEDIWINSTSNMSTSAIVEKKSGEMKDNQDAYITDEMIETKTEPSNIVQSQLKKNSKIEINSQSTQTDGSDKKEIPNENDFRNESLAVELLANEIVSILGFMVYYLLIVLAHRQSDD